MQLICDSFFNLKNSLIELSQMGCEVTLPDVYPNPHKSPLTLLLLTSQMHLLSFPTDPAHPLCPILNVVSVEDLVNGIVLSSELFVGRHTMHKAMARTTQPRDAV